MNTPSILRKLKGGDRRSIGRSSEVVADVLADPRLFGALFAGLSVDDPVVRARAADAIEKISTVHPEYLRPYRAALLGELSRCDQKEVRWHVAQLLPRLRWNVRDRQKVCDILTDYLRDSSSIVKTFAMQALANLTAQAPELRPAVLRQLQKLTVSGTPAMRSRGRKLLKELNGSTRRSARKKD
jgi:HEAT repeat protein